MKRAITALVVLGLIAGALAAPAAAQKRKKKKPPAPVKVERVVEYEYTAPSPAVNPAPGAAVGACMSVLINDVFACANMETSSTEAFAKVEVTDASGQKAYFTMSQDTNDDGIYDIFGQFCGSTPAPVAITPGLVLRVNVSVAGDPACPGPATSGTIKTTISNLP